MQRFIALLPIVLMLTSCAGQVKSNLTPGNAESLGSELITDVAHNPDTTPPIEDPYFIVSKDTFSEYGPGSITRNILQDRNGNYWFATWEGILSYDGQRFTNYTLKDNLKKFHVFSVLEDRTGNLWFGTIGGGVYRYNGKTFSLFTTANGLPNNLILCMFEDHDGNIWIGTDDGVSRFNGQTFTNFSTADGLSGVSVNSIMQDKTGKLWFGTRYGARGDVSYYDGKSFTLFTSKKGYDFSNVRSIIEDKAGNIWIGGQTGLYRYDGKKLASLSTNFIGYIFEDKAGNIWLSEGEDNGMVLTRYDGVTFTKIKSDEQVFGIMEDKAGNIWFGTVYGAYRYDPSQEGGGQVFTNFR